MTRVGVGLDGCRGGWVVALLPQGNPRPRVPEVRVITRIEALDGLLAARAARPLRCLIDIPIGLPTSGVRAVDDAARAALGGRAASVFRVPPRPVFDALDFDEANRLARASMGQGLSVQAWNILGKIREVDLYLRRRLPAPPVLRESHPELAFARLGVDGTLPPKKTVAGRAARVALLERLGVDAAPVLANPPPHPDGRIAADDLLDAVVLALVAGLPAGELETLGPAAATDPLGLPLELLVPRSGAGARLQATASSA